MTKADIHVVDVFLSTQDKHFEYRKEHLTEYDATFKTYLLEDLEILHHF